MNHQSLTRKLFTLAVGSLLTLGALSPAMAGNGYSLGHGVKCYYVLVSSDPATGSNVYATVCGRGA